MTSSKSAARNSRYPLGNTDALKTFILVECPFTEPHHTVREGDTLQLLYGFAGGLYRRWSYRDCRESVCGMHRIENGRYRKEYSAYRRSGLQYEEFLGSDDPGEDYRFVRRYCVRLFPGVGERFERRLPETRRLGSGFL